MARADRRPATPLAFLAAGILLVLGSALVARSGRVGAAERLVFAAVNGLPEALRWPLWSVQLLGLLGVPLVVALVAAARRRLRLAAALVALVPLKLLLEKGVIKQLVARERPGVTVPDAILRDVPAAGLSFPSGHAVVAFGVAALLTPYLRRGWLVAVWALAGLTGVARVYLGAHNPLDVVCGAGVGLLLGGALTLVLGARPAPAPGPVPAAEPGGAPR